MSKNLVNPSGLPMYDIENVAAGAACPTVINPNLYYRGLAGSIVVTAGADFDLASLTQTYSAGPAHTVAYGHAVLKADSANMLKLRLYMNAVLVAESAYLTTSYLLWRVMGHSVLAGSKIVKMAVHNYDAGDTYLYILGDAAGNSLEGIFAGSVKV
jgi:hypothetical protein